ncbi:hypothetical protein, partial [Frankia sp. Cj3]|uniref:hypothetical protein n=1 Tax=Frankia sp. Cj3 TaxID=2880976 RepID=UPI001EF670E1
MIWANRGKSGCDQGSAQLDDHVFEGWFGLAALPRLSEPAGEHVLGLLAVQGIPDDDQGLHQHA